MTALALGACNGDDGGQDGQKFELVDTLDLTAEIEALWPEAPPLVPVAIDSTLDRTPRLPIYLDISSPMSGFVPVPGMGGAAGAVGGGELRPLAQWTSDHLGRTYPEAPLEWYSVAERIRALPDSPPVFRRDIFTGTESRLDLAIDAIIEDLRSGRAEAGAIITDLVGTGESTGAPSVARRLTPWLTSAERRAGDFHFGLIGIQGTYWGAFHRVHCPRRPGVLGCWFSERMPGWKPRLRETVTVPFYILLFGHSAAAMSEVAASIQRDAESQEIEAEWELLTAAGRGQQGTAVTFVAMPEGEPGERQYALLRRPADGAYRCQRSDRVALLGTFADGSRFRPTGTSLAPGSGGAPGPFSVAVNGQRLEALVDCGAVRDSRGTPALHLVVTGAMRPGDRPDWDQWSTEDDHTAEHPGATLQLRYFVAETRVAPESYRIDIPVLTAGES